MTNLLVCRVIETCFTPSNPIFHPETDLPISHNSHSCRETDDGPQAQSRRETKARVYARSLILDTARLLAVEILPTRSGIEALRYLAEAARTDRRALRRHRRGHARCQERRRRLFRPGDGGLSPEEEAGFKGSLPGEGEGEGEGEGGGADGILNLLLERDEPLRLQLAPGEASVLLVNDHAIWRDDIRSLLEDTESDVVGEAASGREAVVLAQELNPDITLLDIRMAGGDGLEARRQIKAAPPPCAVVMLSSYESPTYIARGRARRRRIFAQRPQTRRTDERAARRRRRRNAALARRFDAFAARFRAGQPSFGSDLFQPLSEREIEVLRLLATGLGNREIGELLFVSENTVKTHIVHIIGKLGVSDRVQAAVWAARNGLLKGG